jgi:hypothetical protein
MGRSKTILNRDAQWNEVSRLGRIYVSSEVIMYSIEDVVRITRWSKKVVQNLFNDPSFPSVNYGKHKLVENHALMQFFSVRREKEFEQYWMRLHQKESRKKGKEHV